MQGDASDDGRARGRKRKSHWEENQGSSFNTGTQRSEAASFKAAVQQGIKGNSWDICTHEPFKSWKGIIIPLFIKNVHVRRIRGTWFVDIFSVWWVKWRLSLVKNVSEYLLTQESCTAASFLPEELHSQKQLKGDEVTNEPRRRPKNKGMTVPPLTLCLFPGKLSGMPQTSGKLYGWLAKERKNGLIKTLLTHPE